MVSWMCSVRNGNSQEGIQWTEPARAGIKDPAWQVSAIACSVQWQLEGTGGLHVEAQPAGGESCLFVIQDHILLCIYGNNCICLMIRKTLMNCMFWRHSQASVLDWPHCSYQPAYINAMSETCKHTPRACIACVIYAGTQQHAGQVARRDYCACFRSLVMLQMRPSVQELLCMPYVSQYVHKYAEHIMQLPDHIGHARAPSLNLDQLPIIKQIYR